MDINELKKIINFSNKKLKQNAMFYKDNVHHDYDASIIEKFKQENPEKVEQIKQKLIKKYPHIIYQEKNLNRKLNKEILPPVLMKSDGYFFATKNHEGKKVGKTGGGTHLPYFETFDENYHETGDWAKSMIAVHELESEKQKGGFSIMTELIEGLLEELSAREVVIIKTIYKIPPYQEYDESFLIKEYSLNKQQIDKECDEILKKMRYLIVDKIYNEER